MYGKLEIQANPDLAAELIGKDLASGCLKLFLGAGISRKFGLPSWDDLIKKTLALSGHPITDTDYDKLDFSDRLRLLDKIETSSDYIKHVRSALYDGSTIIDENFLKDAAGMLAIAALCLGTTRGHVQQIFTLNYDDILERYLRLLGLKVDSGDDYMRYQVWCDVRIDHIHGYIPQSTSEKASDEIVFSYESYQERIIALKEKISSWIQNQMMGYKGLFIGLSANDQLLELLIRNIHKEKSNSNHPANIYEGYWILTPDAYKKNSDVLSRQGICPISIDRDDIPNFILSCCKHANIT